MSEEARKTEEDLVQFDCPNCEKGTVILHKAVYDLADGDKMLLLKFECDNCSYTKSDVIPLTTKMVAGVHKLRIDNSEDLKSKVYRSPSAKLEIPELEIAVEPGPSAELYFTNIEGILLRFESAVRIYRKNLPPEDPQVQEIEDILNDIAKALEGNLQFTLILTDDGGGSYILPQDEVKYSFEKLENEPS